MTVAQSNNKSDDKKNKLVTNSRSLPKHRGTSSKNVFLSGSNFSDPSLQLEGLFKSIQV